MEISFSYGAPMQRIDRPGSASPLRLDEAANLRVLKLHGSINWGNWDDDSARVAVWHPHADIVGHNLTPVLVPPTWRKSVSDSLAEVWKQAREQIQLATRLVIIGFSIPETDQDIKYLLAAGLRENLSLREIVFVNPEAPALQSRLTGLFGDLDKRPKIRKVPLYAEQFFGPKVEHGIESIGRPIHGSLHSVQLM